MGTVYTFGAGISGNAAVTAEASDVLNPKVIVDKNGNPITGTMTNRGAWNGTVQVGGELTIPEGYHDGTGKVTTDGIVLDGDASASQVLSGKTFYADSANKLTGTMQNRGAWIGTTAYGGEVTIPEGYHNGQGKVSAGTFTFTGNASPADVLSGKTFYAGNGTKQTGTMANPSVLSAGGLWYDNSHPNGFWTSIYTSGYIAGNGVTAINWSDPESMLSNWSSSDDKSDGNVIRKGPGTSYGTNTFHYTGRTGGSNGRWHEVVVYGWQYR